MTGLINDIQRFSLQDGPGIRTTVFLKGCNMRCVWCHNPETYFQHKNLMFFKNLCIGCGACYKACKTGAMSKDDKNARIFNPEKCTNCGACAEVCAPKALVMAGKEMSIDAVLEIILADKAYYDSSCGGVTVSGGEPLMQSNFVKELLFRCKKNGINTAIESNLSYKREYIERFLPYLDRIYCDFKIFDDEHHIKFTGVSNRTIKENISFLKNYNSNVVVRTPIIPTITDSDENIRNIAAWLHSNAKIEAYELLNYNPLAEMKFEQMFADYQPGKLKRKTLIEMEHLRSIAESEGVNSITRRES
ncbi:MAG: glycyl-radical enzyme activating protein [Sphaerochaetaceae bacterium]|jgi:pyruvate formate lyase activating enzyme|nr:glycyl-radical enzyme activating protein [Sphaerochaetaceae bacterium]